MSRAEPLFNDYDKRPKAMMCVCGHDVYYHDIRIMPPITGHIPDAERLDQEGNVRTVDTRATLGKCNENDGDSYTCPCRKFNSTDLWMHDLYVKVIGELPPKVS